MRGIRPGICGSSMTTTSAPPLARGPPGESQLRSALVRIHSSIWALWSLLRRALGGATPWRMLWFVFVMRKTRGLGLGTYLRRKLVAYTLTSG